MRRGSVGELGDTAVARARSGRGGSRVGELDGGLGTPSGETSVAADGDGGGVPISVSATDDGGRGFTARRVSSEEALRGTPADDAATALRAAASSDASTSGAIPPRRS